MKKYILLLIANIITAGIYSQNPPVLRTLTFEQSYLSTFTLTKGDYIRDTQNTLNQYGGTWVYTNGGTIFTLKLERINSLLVLSIDNGFYYYGDVITAKYKLIKNGQLLFDNLDTPSETSLAGNDARGILENNETNDYINGIFQDFTNNIFISRCEITRLTNALGAPQKIHFMLYPNHSRRMNPKEFYQGMASMYSMPNNVDLIKTD